MTVEPHKIFMFMRTVIQVVITVNERLRNFLWIHFSCVKIETERKSRLPSLLTLRISHGSIYRGLFFPKRGAFRI